MLLEEKVSLLNKVLKQKARIRKGTDAVYFCPKCKHHKRKLEVNLHTGKYNCWVCSFSGLNLVTLLKKIGAPREYFGLFTSSNSWNKTVNISGDMVLDFDKSEAVVKPEVVLPKEYISFKNVSNSIEYKNALRYLLNRNVTKFDILRYQIGYCESGDFAHRVIVPSYNKDGRLDFFVGRSYYESTLKYNNSVASKNFIGFGSMINFCQETTLVEGVFDAFAVRYNCIPLFGKTLSRELKSELLSNPPPVVNVLLDYDARREAITIIEFLLKNNIKTRFINIGEKDPSVLGFSETWDIIRRSPLMDFETMVSMKMN